MPKLANSPAAHDRPANQVHSHTPADLSPHEFDDCLSAIPLIPVSDPAPNNILALGPTSSFRNVSACHRCRLRKHRCDQQLPQCQPCEKAGLRCVGYDLITKQEIPRSYVYFLEHRVNYLEKVLVDHNISFKPAVAYDEDEIEGSGCSFDVVFSQNNPGSSMAGTALEKSERVPRSGSVRSLGKRERSMDAVRKPGGNSACHDSRGNGLQTGTDEAKIIRDSFFGLQAGKSGRACTSLPERDIANELVDVYFEYVNPHMPVLHRDDFMTLLHDVYSTREDFSPYSLFFIYIVYAIGSGVVHDTRTPLAEKNLRGWRLSSGFGDRKRQKVSEQEYKPEEYYSSAMFHLEVSLGSQCQKGEVGRLQELQAVLLLASFALVRPGVPSLGYIARVAVDLAVDLGFQNENGSSRGATHDTHLSGQPSHKDRTAHSDCNLDLRRRLWWCVYSLDRLITPYTGRPFSIPDQIITTDFPSCFDDKYISKSGLISPPDNLPSYKLVACHFFKLRKLQSEIHDVFYHERTICQASLSSAGEKRHSLFLRGFESLASWQKNMLRRLNHWRISVPSAEATGVRFPILYMELDYWNSIIMLYRRNFVDPNELLKSSNSTSSRLRRQQFCGKNEDEHRICLAVAEAGQNVLHIHRIMRQGRFAYFTYLASQSIFQASSLFLFAIWHSPQVRRKYSLNDIDYTILTGASVLNDLVAKCSMAGEYQQALECLSIAVIQKYLITTGLKFPLPISNNCSSSKPKAFSPEVQFPSTEIRPDPNPIHKSPPCPHSTQPFRMSSEDFGYNDHYSDHLKGPFNASYSGNDTLSLISDITTQGDSSYSQQMCNSCSSQNYGNQDSSHGLLQDQVTGSFLCSPTSAFTPRDSHHSTEDHISNISLLDLDLEELTCIPEVICGDVLCSPGETASSGPGDALPRDSNFRCEIKGKPEQKCVDHVDQDLREGYVVGWSDC